MMDSADHRHDATHILHFCSRVADVEHSRTGIVYTCHRYTCKGDSL